MKPTSTALLALSIATIAAPAIAQTAYQGTQLGGNAIITWQSWDSINREANPAGYLCLTRDNIESGRGDTYVNRYALVPQGMDYRLEPLNAVSISLNQNGQFVAIGVDPISTDTIWNSAPLDESGEWFESNIEPEPLGTACINGGVAGAIDYLEQTYGVDIR